MSIKQDIYNDLTAYGSLSFALILFFSVLLLGNPQTAIEIGLCLAISYMVTFPIKFFFFKQRPNKQTYTNIIEKIDASSFPSLHSMRTVSMSIPLILAIQNPLFTFLVSLVVGGVLYTRITLKKHFLTDVVAGSLIGIVIGLVISLSSAGEWATGIYLGILSLLQ